jgi:UPF0755 protein
LSRGNRSRPAHERTAQERESDRLERERRRAGRAAPGEVEAQAEAQPPPPPDPTPQLPDPVPNKPELAPHTPDQAPYASDPAPQPPAEGSSAQAQPQAPYVSDPTSQTPEAAPPQMPEAAPQPLDTHVAADEPIVHDDTQGAAGEPIAAEPDAGEPVAGELAAGEHAPPPWDVSEAVAEGRRPAASTPTDPRRPAASTPTDRPARPLGAGVGAGVGVARGGRKGGGVGAGRARGRRAGGHGGRRVTRARVAALLALVAGVALVWFLLSLFQPFAGSGSGKVIVTIPKGSGASKVGSILEREGVVSSGFFFDVRALLDGKRSSLHSGRFVLKRDMSYSAAIDALSKPPPRVIAVKVVIPEGYTRRQIADLVREDALTGSYLAASERSRVLDPAHYGAPAGTTNLEGFLFPATYDLTAGAPAKRLVDEQLTAFRQRFSSADRRRARALKVTPYELLTVASMIEREAQTEHDRPLIAAVIYNRLREGDPLGIDATIYYAVEQRLGIATYSGELTESQLKIDSPYNTRTHKGLPPTPISNPGEASIHAAAHPAHVHYLYYVAGADGCGEQAFSDTEAQFEKNAAAYRAAVKKNGGHPPKCTKK